MDKISTEVLIFFGGVLLAGFRSYLGKILIQAIIGVLSSLIRWTEEDIKTYNRYIKLEQAKRAKKG